MYVGMKLTPIFDRIFSGIHMLCTVHDTTGLTLVGFINVKYFHTEKQNLVYYYSDYNKSKGFFVTFIEQGAE